MDCYEIGPISLTSNCWNAESQNFMRFPCREITCQEIPSSNPNEGGLPDWGLALIIVAVVAVFGGLAFYFLKKKCSNGFSFIFGGILAASMTPPLPRSDEAGTIRAQKLDLEGQGGGQDLTPTAPPSYDSIV